MKRNEIWIKIYLSILSTYLIIIYFTLLCIYFRNKRYCSHFQFICNDSSFIRTARSNRKGAKSITLKFKSCPLSDNVCCHKFLLQSVFHHFIRIQVEETNRLLHRLSLANISDKTFIRRTTCLKSQTNLPHNLHSNWHPRPQHETQTINPWNMGVHPFLLK